MLHISLFSGIGGFDLAAEWMGWTNIASCEINDFGNKILEYYWPDAYHHRDIHTLNYALINDHLTKRYGPTWPTNDIILTGGFPCQPYSVAGKRLGKEDDRHLWPEMLRVISEVKPTFIVGENVGGLLSWSGGMVFDEVRADLESQGYEVAVYLLPAAGVNAPHKRERVWIIANSNCQRCEKCHASTKSSKKSRQHCQAHYNFKSNHWERFPNEPAICSRNDGLSTKLDNITFSKWRNETIKAGGNAIVPQVAFEIFKAIEKAYNHERTKL